MCQVEFKSSSADKNSIKENYKDLETFAKTNSIFSSNNKNFKIIIINDEEELN